MAEMTVVVATRGARPPLRPPGLPIIAGLAAELLPALAALWTIMLGAWVITGRPYFVPLVLWGTVTTIMLWPVGRRLGLLYPSYRTWLFILGVLSMAYIPVIGFILQSGLPYTTKVALWLLLPLDLTVFAILPSLRPAIGRPVGMFFRPDMLFGDGRVLCCGTVALLFGIRYLIGPHPPDNIPIAIPKWDWWGIALAMGLGFIPMIPLRGMTKLIMRMARLIRDEWYGWWGVILKETFLVVTLLAIALGFHHVFKGWIPFGPQFWGEVRETIAHRGPWAGILLLSFGYVWLVFVRGGYKKSIGEPFIRETITQTWIKELLYVPGVVTLIPGLMFLIEAHFGQLNKPSMLAVGIPFFLWGLAVVTIFRVLAQVNQRRAIVQQMAAVVLPAQLPEVRINVISKILNALCEMPEKQRLFYMRAMQEAISQAGESVREVMTRDRLACVAALPADRRRTIMMSMDKILLGTA
jgi:hypothetical protein